MLTPLRTPTSHAAVEMHWNLIIPSSYDSLLCWLVWWLLGCCHSAAETQGVQVLLLWFSFTYLLTYSYIFIFLPLLPKWPSHSGEQHRAAGCASWGGSGRAEEHLRHGLSQGGQAWTGASQWHVCPSGLLKQYVSTSSCKSKLPTLLKMV